MYVGFLVVALLIAVVAVAICNEVVGIPRIILVGIYIAAAAAVAYYLYNVWRFYPTLIDVKLDPTLTEVNPKLLAISEYRKAIRRGLWWDSPDAKKEILGRWNIAQQKVNYGTFAEAQSTADEPQTNFSALLHETDAATTYIIGVKMR